MNAIKNYFRSVWSYVSKPEAYIAVPARPLRTCISYLYRLCLCTSAVIAIPIIITLAVLIPSAHEGISTFRDDALSMYPESLVLTVKDGELSSNVEEPYVIEFPSRWKSIFTNDDPEEENAYDHLATIATKMSVEDYHLTKSLILITKRSLVMADKDGGLRVMPLSQFGPDITITHQMYAGILRSISPFLKYIVPLLSASLVLWAFLLPIFMAGAAIMQALIYLLLLTLILWITSAVMKKGYSYVELYKMGIYGYTVLALSSLVLDMITLHIPYLPSILFLGWMIYVLRQLPRQNLPLAPMTAPSVRPPAATPVRKKLIARKTTKK